MYGWVAIQYLIYRAKPSFRRAFNKMFVCPFVGHWRKFDTHPRRGLCIRCQAR